MRKYFLKSDRIGFSLWTGNDLAFAMKLWGEPEVTHFICASGKFSIRNIEERLQVEIENYKNNNVQYFPIFELESGDLLGCCGLRPCVDEKDAFELGFHLRKEYWHQGYAFEAAAAMIQYAFTELKAGKLEAGHHPQNVASQKLLTKLGFQYIGDSFYKPTGMNHPSYILKNEVQISD